MMKFNTLAVAAAVMAAAFASSAQATITAYNSQSIFLSAVSAPATDTFETFPLGVDGTSATRSVGSYGYTVGAQGGLFGVGSTGDHWLSANSAGDTLTFNAFTGGVSALGGFFFNTDFGGAFTLGEVTITAIDASGTVVVHVPNATTGTFWGFVSDGPLTSVTLSSVIVANPIFPTVNDLILAGQAGGVPEPATWALMIGGLALAGAALRRRKAALPGRVAA